MRHKIVYRYFDFATLLESLKRSLQELEVERVGMIEVVLVVGGLLVLLLVQDLNKNILFYYYYFLTLLLLFLNIKLSRRFGANMTL